MLRALTVIRVLRLPQRPVPRIPRVVVPLRAASSGGHDERQLPPARKPLVGSGRCSFVIAGGRLVEMSTSLLRSVVAPERMSIAQAVDIKGIDRVALLEQMWTATAPARFFRNNNMSPPDFDVQEARLALREGYIGYLCGRPIKTHMSNDVVDPRTYDSYAGAEGTLARIVAALRQKE